jgi:hypothetical protein
MRTTDAPHVRVDLQQAQTVGTQSVDAMLVDRAGGVQRSVELGRIGDVAAVLSALPLCCCRRRLRFCFVGVLEFVEIDL